MNNTLGLGSIGLFEFAYNLNAHRGLQFRNGETHGFAILELGFLDGERVFIDMLASVVRGAFQ